MSSYLKIPSKMSGFCLSESNIIIVGPQPQTELQILISLKNIDHDIGSINSKIRDIRKEIDLACTEINNTEKAIISLQIDLNKQSKEKSSLSLKINEILQRIESISNNLKSVKTSSGYYDVFKTIDSLKKEVKVYESKIPIIDKSILDIKGLIGINMDRLVKENENVKGLKELKNKEIAFLNESIQNLYRQREEYINRMEIRLLNKYRKIHLKHNSNFLVKLDNNMCSECNIVVPYPKIEEVNSRVLAVDCPHCGRFLY